MQCVKCDEGELKKIVFKKTRKNAYVCDYCSTFWMEDELIRYDTGHALDPYRPGDDYEYAVQELETVDEDHQAVKEVSIL